MNQKQYSRIFILNISFISDRISDYMCEYVRQRLKCAKSSLQKHSSCQRTLTIYYLNLYYRFYDINFFLLFDKSEIFLKTHFFTQAGKPTRQKIVKVQGYKSVNGIQAYKSYNSWFFFGIREQGGQGRVFNKYLTHEYNLKREVHIVQGFVMKKQQIEHRHEDIGSMLLFDYHVSLIMAGT